jgi:hypothetical protein
MAHCPAAERAVETLMNSDQVKESERRNKVTIPLLLFDHEYNMYDVDNV